MNTEVLAVPETQSRLEPTPALPNETKETATVTIAPPKADAKPQTQATTDIQAKLGMSIDCLEPTDDFAKKLTAAGISTVYGLAHMTETEVLSQFKLSGFNEAKDKLLGIGLKIGYSASVPVSVPAIAAPIAATPVPVPATPIDIPVAKKTKTKVSKKAKVKVVKTKAKTRAKKVAKVKPAKSATTPVKTKGESLLDLGAGYKMRCKQGTGYAVLYETAAKKGNFAEVATELEAGKYDPAKKEDADALLAKMLIPIAKLAIWCRNAASWKKYAEKRTTQLLSEAKGQSEGDKKRKRSAQNVLKDLKRCGEDGGWIGNFNEMLSVCIGYWNYMYPENQKEAPKELNRNACKFQKAKIFFRRFPLARSSEPAFILMFPDKFGDVIRQAIETSRGVKEPSKRTDLDQAPVPSASTPTISVPQVS